MLIALLLLLIAVAAASLSVYQGVEVEAKLARQPIRIAPRRRR